MYSETNRRAASRRCDDEFLRRMLGGELGNLSCPMPQNVANPPMSPMPPMTPDMPGCNRRTAETRLSNDGDCDCPKTLSAPSLAMVYAPRQCWNNLLEPEAALACGTLFADLVLPFEGKNCRGEVKLPKM